MAPEITTEAGDLDEEVEDWLRIADGATGALLDSPSNREVSGERAASISAVGSSRRPREPS